MTLFQVGIPWRPTADRTPAFEATAAFYRSHGFEVIASDAKRHHPQFNIAAARNYLVRTLMQPAEVYVLSDADTTPEFPALVEAIKAVLAGSPAVHLPYHLYRQESDGAFTENACSGVLVFGPSAWETLNGQDETFEGWGFEDTAFKLAHETLIGPMVRHSGVALARNHVPARKDRVSVNRRRYFRYREAYGHPEAMRALVGPVTPLPKLNVAIGDIPVPAIPRPSVLGPIAIATPPGAFAAPVLS